MTDEEYDRFLDTVDTDTLRDGLAYCNSPGCAGCDQIRRALERRGFIRRWGPTR